MVGGTVSIPLRELQAIVGPEILNIEQWIRDHSLFGYERLNLSEAVAESLRKRIETGFGKLAHTKFAHWIVERLLRDRVCPKCETEAWLAGLRATLCPHQIDFVTACWKHGIRLVRRTVGAHPPSGRRGGKVTALELAYARSAFNVWQEGIDVTKLATRLRTELDNLGYFHDNGRCRVSKLGRDLQEFIAPFPNARLRKMIRGDLCSRQLFQWIEGRRTGIQPPKVVVLDAFLRSVAGESP